MGADPNDPDIFLTSTCRAQLNTESLVWYLAQNEASFWVFDWARTSHWQVGINLPGDHPEYLANRPDEFANTRPMCHIRNGTYYLGISHSLYQWRNRVLLFNFPRGDWDLVYSYDYTTTNLSDNLFQTGSGGYWGPIVETFGGYTNVNPIGFDLARFFQDGDPAPRWLSPANSYRLQAYPFKSLTEAPNTSFAVYVGSINPDAFLIAAISRNALSNQVTATLNSQPGRNYLLYTSSIPGPNWVQSGPPVPGSGGPIHFQRPATSPSAFFRAAAAYNSGTLCVTANTNTAGFSLSPTGGLVSPYWISTPNGDRWDKTVVGLAPGTYTVTFSNAPGLVPPAPQNCGCPQQPHNHRASGVPARPAPGPPTSEPARQRLFKINPLPPPAVVECLHPPRLQIHLDPLLQLRNSGSHGDLQPQCQPGVCHWNI